MILEQLDKNKIKAVVDLSEQLEYGVTYESMNYSDGNTRRLCESIMEKAKTEMGFNITGSKLLVEAKQSSDGTVTLYLSKISVSEPVNDQLFGQTVVFEDIDALCDCRALVKTARDKLTDMRIYAYENKYYMYFELICRRDEAGRFLRALLEYGEKTKISPEFLGEHGKQLILKYTI